MKCVIRKDFEEENQVAELYSFEELSDLIDKFCEEHNVQSGNAPEIDLGIDANYCLFFDKYSNPHYINIHVCPRYSTTAGVKELTTRTLRKNSYVLLSEGGVWLLTQQELNAMIDKNSVIPTVDTNKQKETLLKMIGNLTVAVEKEIVFNPLFSSLKKMELDVQEAYDLLYKELKGDSDGPVNSTIDNLMVNLIMLKLCIASHNGYKIDC